MGDHVIPFRPRVEPVAGTISFSNQDLVLPCGKQHYGPQWGFAAKARIGGANSDVPVQASLVAEIPDEPDSLGWLDRDDDGFSGKFVVGADWEDVIRQAAFSPLSWDIEISFATDVEGAVVQLRLGMFRRQVEG